MTYNTYEITIAGVNGEPKFFRFPAVDHHAAVADVKATYGDDVEILAVWLM